MATASGSADMTHCEVILPPLPEISNETPSDPPVLPPPDPEDITPDAPQPTTSDPPLDPSHSSASQETQLATPSPREETIVPDEIVVQPLPAGQHIPHAAIHRLPRQLTPPPPDPPAPRQRETRAAAQRSRDEIQRLKQSRLLLTYALHHPELEIIDYNTYIPSSVEDALSCPAVDKWNDAIHSEINSLMEHNVLKLVSPSHDAKFIPSRLLLTIKDTDTDNPRFKC